MNEQLCKILSTNSADKPGTVTTGVSQPGSNDKHGVADEAYEESKEEIKDAIDGDVSRGLDMRGDLL